MTSARPCGMSKITAWLAHVVREMSLNGLIGRAIWYRYNHPFGQHWLAHVVQEVTLKGLSALVSTIVGFKVDNSMSIRQAIQNPIQEKLLSEVKREKVNCQ